MQINELRETINNFSLDFIERERTSRGTIDLGILLYASGLSFRKTAYVLSQIEEEITHVSVWKWVQKHGNGLRARLYLDNGDIPEILVVDETKIQIGSKQHYLYAAICPDSKRIIYAEIYPMRNYLATRTFFKRIIKIYGKRPGLVVTDGGPWYPEALRRLGIKFQVISGSIRNYIERWYKSFKTRVKAFDKYFPHKKSYDHIINWLNTFIYFYNRVRRHMSLGDMTPLEYYRRA